MTLIVSCSKYSFSVQPKYNSNDHKYAFLRALSVAASPAAADSESMKGASGFGLLCHVRGSKIT